MATKVFKNTLTLTRKEITIEEVPAHRIITIVDDDPNREQYLNLYDLLGHIPGVKSADEFAKPNEWTSWIETMPACYDIVAYNDLPDEFDEILKANNLSCGGVRHIPYQPSTKKNIIERTFEYPLAKCLSAFMDGYKAVKCEIKLVTNFDDFIHINDLGVEDAYCDIPRGTQVKCMKNGMVPDYERYVDRNYSTVNFTNNINNPIFLHQTLVGCAVKFPKDNQSFSYLWYNNDLRKKLTETCIYSYRKEWFKDFYESTTVSPTFC